MWAKWLFDRVFSLIGLILLSPLFVVVAILIHVKMPDGPILFKQIRVGRYGKPFTLYKFRSMVVAHKGATISVAGEARITPLGAKLRKYKLDELPQLWNVFIGDMSFVGPRPDVQEWIDKLTEKERVILTLRPGITGPASLKYHNEEELLRNSDNPLEYYEQVIFPDKNRINMEYLHHWSFWKDVKYIIQTII